MKFRWNRWDTVILVLALLPGVFAWAVYDRLPDRVPSHFGPSGKPDDYSDKEVFIPMMSGLILSLPFFIKWLPFIDPRRENYRKFTRFYEIFRLVLTLFLGGVFVATLLYTLGYPVNLSKIMPVGLGLLWIVLGNFMGQVRPNWFFGIRLPWTLENEEVWRRTHRFTGPLWVGAGILILFTALLPAGMTFWVVLPILILSSLLPMVYAYAVYRKLSGDS
ncbi:putative membrane protein [Melghirimyces profundicolus]|uniref:Putative membrane protein n=1 Tax=Melghirimyces profundicolus TaxID=1242148 RepID=A0A2T6C4S4_9BACL|nr:SdpI family protein [Melghirimyces profundicolus]PTX63283.1 putative membrane protein [Melghirimyces profundicolus]